LHSQQPGTSAKEKKENKSNPQHIKILCKFFIKIRFVYLKSNYGMTSRIFTEKVVKRDDAIARSFYLIFTELPRLLILR